MIANKHVSALIRALTAAAVLFCLCGMALSGNLQSDAGVDMQYEDELFDTSKIITLNIAMDSSDWDEMLASAASETYYPCDVTVNGTTFYNVAIRPKGNTSLSAIVQDPDNNRYSFKLEFGHYEKGQTCFGLDKLVLNNNYADATNMKEAVVYDMFAYLGADASLYNYADISVNGEYWGVYLALEAVEDSFMLRSYGVQSGELYKPDSMDAGGGVSSGGGANLEYTDDELSSYQTIWDGSVTDTADGDHRRVVKALKNVCAGEELETYLDVDNVLRYMAVQSFVVNDDSLSGMMAHNYYLYEYQGRLNIIPWDYNLAFGGMSANGVSAASDVVNDPIDTPFNATTFFDALLENEEYLAKYHEYYSLLVEKYVDGGGFDALYSRLRAQLDSLVETDPNAMYTYEEYDAAAEMLLKTVKLRAESAACQLAGSIPSTSAGRRADSSALIDASDIDISLMGTFAMGMGDKQGGGNLQPSAGTQSSGEMPSMPSGDGTMGSGDAPSMPSGDMPSDFDPTQGGMGGGAQTPSGGESQSGASDWVGNAIWLGGSFALALAGLGFALLYKRKPAKPRRAKAKKQRREEP